MLSDLLTQHVEVVILISILMRAGLAWQKELSWYEYRTLHGLKRMLFPTLDRVEPFGFGLFVTETWGRDSEEYVTTVDATVRQTAKTLQQSGATLHLLSSIKKRPSGYSHAHLVWTDGDEQLEVWLYRNGNSTVDVYAHREASITDPDDHINGEGIVKGDPSGRVQAALESVE